MSRMAINTERSVATQVRGMANSHTVARLIDQLVALPARPFDFSHVLPPRGEGARAEHPLEFRVASMVTLDAGQFRVRGAKVSGDIDIGQHLHSIAKPDR